ncbi:MAG: hypothetical protein NT130_04895 [Candidatus Micrarchaeota archaeon]|nr:hypothetical protein [Candidatus Micrarchaeota archaeon]
MTAAAFQAVWNNWQAVAIIAAVLSILFTSIAYSLAEVFKLKSLQQWAKDEFYQALASAFIAGVAVIVITAISSFSCSVIGGCAAGDHMDKAINIMTTLTDSVTDQIQYMFSLNLRAGMISQAGKFYDFSLGSYECMVGDCPMAIGFNWYPWAGGSIVTESLEYAFGLLIPLISSFIAQRYILEFTKTALFPTLLAMGIILRTFFFTRKVGGLLIAIALALYTIYPLMYIMLESYFTFEPHNFYYADTDSTSTINGISLNCGLSFLPDGTQEFPFCMGPGGLASYILIGLPQSAGNYGRVTYMFQNGCRDNGDCPGAGNSCGVNIATGQQMCQGTYGSDVYAGMLSPYNGVLPTVGYLLVPGVFLPLLIILITISFIKVLSPQLGGDIEISGVTRFI